jgi:cytochrome c oxidase cbb3-type subunit III
MHTRDCVWILMILVCAASLSGVIYARAHAAYLGTALVRSWPNDILKDPELMRFAQQEGPHVYRDHCASCHGARLQGDRTRGVPDLADAVWLYGTGSISDIETTLLYGIRSGHPKAHNLADMPGFGRGGQLSKQDIHDVVQYVLLISGQPHDEDAAQRGRQIYQGAGVCYDCHGSDGYGVSDYGTPALTGRGGSWLYGGDRDTLYKTVYDGRHGLCPAWIGKLSFVQIRALSVYLYELSNHG